MFGIVIFGALLPLAYLEQPADDATPHKSLASAIDVVKAVQAGQVPSSEVVHLSAAFSALTAEELHLLKQDDDISVALRAAWEQQKRLLNSIGNDELRKRPGRRADRLLGFIEGKLRVGIPPCWEKAVQSAYLHESGMVIFRDYRSTVYADTPLGIAAPQSLAITLVDDQTTVKFTIDGRSIAVPVAVVDKLKDKGPETMTVCLHDGLCLLLGAGLDAQSLVCYDSNARRCRWQADNWGIGPLLLYQGPPPRNCADVVCVGSRATVFGVSGRAAYIESFNLADGRPLFRFSTNDWQNEGGLLPPTEAPKRK